MLMSRECKRSGRVLTRSLTLPARQAGRGTYGVALGSEPYPPLRLLPGGGLPAQHVGPHPAVPGDPRLGPCSARTLAAPVRTDQAARQRFSDLVHRRAWVTCPDANAATDASLAPALA